MQIQLSPLPAYLAEVISSNEFNRPHDCWGNCLGLMLWTLRNPKHRFYYVLGTVESSGVRREYAFLKEGYAYYDPTPTGNEGPRAYEVEYECSIELLMKKITTSFHRGLVMDILRREVELPRFEMLDDRSVGFRRSGGTGRAASLQP